MTSWKASRSPVQMTTSMPSAVGLRRERGDDVVGLEAVDLTWRIRRASSTSRTSATWPWNSLGVAERVALYSAYSSARNVWRETSKATATWVGCLVTQHVDEHRREAVDGVGVLTGAGREVLHRQREERAVGQGMAVEEQEATHAWQPMAMAPTAETATTERPHPEDRTSLVREMRR